MDSAETMWITVNPCTDQGCYMHIYLRKFSGLKLERQYNPDYQCPSCTNDGDGAEIDKEEEELNKTCYWIILIQFKFNFC